jgi:Cu2+-exporting ATPase
VRFAFHDHIRPESAALVRGFAERDIGVEMVTGDRTAPAAEIARAAGIALWRAGVSPAGKAAYLKGLQDHDLKVLMVGDGLNDAAALALAHVSVAPGSATDVSQLAADMVLRGDSLAPLLEAVDVARKAKILVLQNFAVAALYNVAAIPLAALGLVSPAIAAATMASSSLLVTLNALRLVRP